MMREQKNIASERPGELTEPSGEAKVSGINSEDTKPHEPMELTCFVFLIGFMGAGKTTVARKLARMCSIASVDMDTYLERREGRRIKDIFAEEGEQAFRLIETDVLRELVQKPTPLLISCGGGVVMRKENRALLKEHGFVVYLRVSAQVAAKRISNTSSRPLFKELDQAQKLCEERSAVYESVADAAVDTADKRISDIAREVRFLLERKGVLCRQQRS